MAERKIIGVGMKPRLYKQVDKIARDGGFTTSTVVNILVEEALIARGMLEPKGNQERDRLRIGGDTKND